MNIFRLLFYSSDEEYNKAHEDFRRDVLGEYTEEEARQIELEDKENYNKNIRPAYFWAGANKWIDADGVERDF